MRMPGLAFGNLRRLRGHGKWQHARILALSPCRYLMAGQVFCLAAHLYGWRALLQDGRGGSSSTSRHMQQCPGRRRDGAMRRGGLRPHKAHECPTFFGGPLSSQGCSRRAAAQGLEIQAMRLGIDAVVPCGARGRGQLQPSSPTFTRAPLTSNVQLRAKSSGSPLSRSQSQPSPGCLSTWHGVGLAVSLSHDARNASRQMRGYSDILAIRT